MAKKQKPHHPSSSASIVKILTVNQKWMGLLSCTRWEEDGYSGLVIEDSLERLNCSLEGVEGFVFIYTLKETK